MNKGPAAARLGLEEKYRAFFEEKLELASGVSYVDNKKIPLLRLYRYKEAFSFNLVNHFLDIFRAGRNDIVFDPFAGMGTTLFASMLRGLPSVGVERLPFAAFVSEALVKLLKCSPAEIGTTFERLCEIVDKCSPAPVASDVNLVSIAFDEPTLVRLRKWKAAIQTLNSPLQDVFLFLLLSVLESTSRISNDGQFPRVKRDKKPLWPDDALQNKVIQTHSDLITVRSLWPHLDNCSEPRVYVGDTRDLSSMGFDGTPSIIITSPPYPNRYDYTRSYCLELCFHFVRNFSELRELRMNLLRSHIEARVHFNESPCHSAVGEVVQILKDQKLNNPRIPLMLTAYFLDMEKAIREWSRIMRRGGRVALVVDNVRFYGEVIPVDLILCDLAERHGFVTEKILIARYKGNSSQQMGRFKRVRVRESVLLWRKILSTTSA